MVNTPDRILIDNDILPIFISKNRTPHEVISFEGTGFLIGKNLFVTCWHCVSTELSNDQSYFVALKNANNKYLLKPLTNIEQDKNRTDLATSSIELSSNLQLKLPDGDVAIGTNVMTFGYPFTDKVIDRESGIHFKLNNRYLEGYITRIFYFEHPIFGSVPSYELDMPNPPGLSGAPLIKIGTREIIGVVYGINDVAKIEEFSSVDPVTGNRMPEIQRITSFGLAHYTQSLRNLRGKATSDLPLHEYLKK